MTYKRPLFLIILLSLSSPSFANERTIHSACSSSKDDARKELAKTLYTEIKSTVSKFVSVSGNGGNENIDIMMKTADEQSTQMTLCNVKVVAKDGQFCASVTNKELTDCAQKRLSEQSTHFLISNLPITGAPRGEKARKWLDDIISSNGLYRVVGKNNLNQSQLKKLVSIENDLLNVLNKQYVRFDVQGAIVKIHLDNGRAIPNNQDIELKNGTYSYAIRSSDHCTINENFTLTPKVRKVVRYDMDNYTFPKITFTSTPPNAQLKIGGESATDGTTRTVTRCDGVLPYSFALSGVNKTGEVKLSPGLNKTISVKFTPPHILNTAQSYRSGKKIWQAHFHNLFPTHKENGVGRLSGFKVSQLTLKESFRWGYFGAFATDADNSSAYELGAEFSLQLLDYNLGREALFLGPFFIMPSAGIEAGIAYHYLDGNSSFGASDASNWENIYQSYFLLRPKIAIDAAFNKDYSFSLSYSHSLFMNRSNVLALGLGLRF